jgi:tRNA A-37 threonylcarbamoyl transferase component Bud32
MTLRPSSHGSIVDVTLLYCELDAAVDFEGLRRQAPNQASGACRAKNAGERKTAIAAAATRICDLTADNIASPASPVKVMDFGLGTYYHSAELYGR